HVSLLFGICLSRFIRLPLKSYAPEFIQVASPRLPNHLNKIRPSILTRNGTHLLSVPTRCWVIAGRNRSIFTLHFLHRHAEDRCRGTTSVAGTCAEWATVGDNPAAWVIFGYRTGPRSSHTSVDLSLFIWL